LGKASVQEVVTAGPAARHCAMEGVAEDGSLEERIARSRFTGYLGELHALSVVRVLSQQCPETAHNRLENLLVLT